MKAEVSKKIDQHPEIKELQSQVRELRNWKADTIWLMKQQSDYNKRRFESLESSRRMTNRTITWIVIFNMTALAWLCFITFVLCK